MPSRFTSASLALAEKDRGGPDNAYVQSALNDLIEVYR